MSYFKPKMHLIRFRLGVNMTSQWANFFIECDPQSSTKSQDNQRFRKIEIYIHKIINSNSNINVYRTFNNNVIVYKTQNKLPEPKYLATEISVSIASSRTFVKTMVTLGNQVGSNPGKHIQMNIDIFYIIKSAIISVPSNTWQRSFRTTLHRRQSQFIRFNPG